jgi:hypothetical protein
MAEETVKFKICNHGDYPNRDIYAGDCLIVCDICGRLKLTSCYPTKENANITEFFVAARSVKRDSIVTVGCELYDAKNPPVFNIEA